MLAAIYALYVHETAFGFAGRSERLEAQSLALAGVELAAYQLTANPKVQPVRGKFSFRLGPAEVYVDFRSENSRIDLNFASPQVLAGLFVGFGARYDDAQIYAQRIERLADAACVSSNRHRSRTIPKRRQELRPPPWTVSTRQ